jgi:hypothetical protein
MFDLRRIEFIKRSNLDASVIESIAFAVINLIAPRSKHKKISQLFSQNTITSSLFSEMLLRFSNNKFNDKIKSNTCFKILMDE